MASLPSYEDATSRLDWLELVAPYVPVRDLGRLCSVNRRFYRVFAPRLWNDPLPMVRTLGLQQSNGEHDMPPRPLHDDAFLPRPQRRPRQVLFVLSILPCIFQKVA
jgi:hypothetical protein